MKILFFVALTMPMTLVTNYEDNLKNINAIMSRYTDPKRTVSSPTFYHQLLSEIHTECLSAGVCTKDHITVKEVGEFSLANMAMGGFLALTILKHGLNK